MKSESLTLQARTTVVSWLIPLLAFSGLVANGLRGADRTWDGGGDTGYWGNNVNWSGDLLPAAGDSLFFTLTTRRNNTNDFAAGTVFNGITFNSPAAAFNLRGNQVALGGGITNNQVVTPQTISLPLSLSATRTVSTVEGASLTLGGVISGAGGLSKTGAGEVTLGGANTFSGAVAIHQGAVSVSSDGNLGAAPGAATPGSLVLDGGTLHVTADFTLNPNRGVAVGPGEGTILTDDGDSLIYRGVIANNGGTGGLTKNGFGDITLSGANTYTGPTAIKVGTINLDFTQGDSPASDIINSSSALTLGGENAGLGDQDYAAIVMNAAIAGTHAQTFNGTTIGVGPARIRAVGTGGTANLALGALANTPGGIVNIASPATGTGGAGNITTTTSNTHGIIGGWATVGSGAENRGIATATDWASVDGTGNIVAYTGYTILPNGTSLNSISTPDTNLRIDSTSSGDVTVAPNGTGLVEVNTINLHQARAMSIHIGEGNTLRLGKFGGISKSDTATTTWAFSDSTGGANGGQDIGTLTAGGAENAPGEIVFTLNSSSQSTGSLNVDNQIVDNGSGVVTVVKSGMSSMKFRGHNTYSGGTYILQGRFQLAGSEVGTANPNGWGTGPLVIYPGGQAFPSGISGSSPFTNSIRMAGVGTDQENTGAIRLGNGSLYTGPIELIGDARLGGGGGSGAIMSGPITGNFSLGFGSSGNVGGSGSVVILNNPANDWTGDTIVLGRTGGSAGNGRLVLGTSEVIPNGFGRGNVTVGLSGVSVSTCTLDLAGVNETINGLFSAGNEANVFIENNGTNAAVLTVGDNNQSGTFGGTLRDGTGLANNLGTGGGFSPLGLTKIGGGLLTLTGPNSYTGPTVVTAGTLALSGSGTIVSSDIFLNGGSLDIAELATDFAATATVRMNNGTLVAGAVGLNAPVLGMTNSGLTVTLDQTRVNLQAGALSTGGTTNLINIASVLNISGYPAQFTVIDYNGAIGGAGNNFALGAVPSPVTIGYVTNDTASGRILLVLLNGPKPLTWRGSAGADWDIGTTENWIAFKGTPNEEPASFFTADFAIFDDSGETNRVNLTEALEPGGVTVNSAMNYTFYGPGSIAGLGGLVKDGSGTLIVANSAANTFAGKVLINAGAVQVGTNGTTGNLPAVAVVNNGALVFSRSDTLSENLLISGPGTLTQNGSGVLALNGASTYEGQTVVSQGTLRAGNPSALGTPALPGTDPGTIVNSGATLDVGGQNLTTESVTVSGAGVGGNGAVINSGAEQQNALIHVTLAGDTTVGGTGRWDIRGTGASLNTGGSPFNLTKKGTNQFSLVGVNVDAALADINVQAGILGVETSTTLGNPANTLTVSAGATLQFFNSTVPHGKTFVLNGNGLANTVNTPSGAENTISGPVTLNGICIFNNGTSDDHLTLSGSVGGTGGIVKTGGSELRLTGTASYAGNTIVNGGTLVVNTTLSGGGTLSNITGTTISGLGTNIGPAYIRGALQPGGLDVVGNFGTGPLTLNAAQLTFDIGKLDQSSQPGSDRLAVNGALTASGVTTITLSPGLPGNLTNGQVITVIQYNSGPAPTAASFSLAAAPAGYAFSLVDPATTPNLVQVRVDSAPGTLVWRGNDAVNPTRWDEQVTTNWAQIGSGLPSAFRNLDVVTFDDSSSTRTVNLVGDLRPGDIHVNHGSGSYTFTGTGALNGPGGLEMGSAGTLVVANSGSNGFTGPINVGSAVLQVGNGGADGNLGGGALTNNGALIFNRSGNLLVNNSIYGSGSISNAGPGVTTLGGANAGFDGPIIVAQGTLRAGTSTSLGSVASGIIVSNGATFDVGANNNNFGQEMITVSGSGVGGNGAIVNNSGSETFVGVNIQNVTMTGNTVFGGTGRLDFRATAADAGGDAFLAFDPPGSAFNLTKKGVNQLQLASVQVDPGLANIDVQGGIFGLQGYMPSLGNPASTLTVAAGATLRVFNTGAAGSSFDKVFVFNGDGVALTVDAASGPDNTLAGPVTLIGPCIFNNGGSDDNLTLANTVAGSGSLIKTGGSELRLMTNATYAGDTTVNGGALVLLNNGAISGSHLITVGAGAVLDPSARADGTLTLLSGQTLAGNGTVRGMVSAGAGSTVSPGLSIGTLTVTNIVLGGTTVMEIDAPNHTNDVLRTTAGSITYGGTLIVTNVGGNITGTNIFQLFSGPVSGSFGNNITLPQISGVTWDVSSLGIDGTIKAIGSAVNTTPTNLVFQVVGNTLDISWPDSYTGWRLEAQTNSLSVGLSTGWFTVAGSTTTNRIVAPIGRENGTVFYRLVYP